MFSKYGISLSRCCSVAEIFNAVSEQTYHFSHSSPLASSSLQTSFYAIFLYESESLFCTSPSFAPSSKRFQVEDEDQVEMSMATRSELQTSFVSIPRLLLLSSPALVLLFLIGCNEMVEFNKAMGISDERRSTTFTRKLLQSYDDGGDTNRIGRECSKDDIAIYQGQIPPLPNGIPAFTVQILNSCVSGCSISDIHVSCGWFSSVRLVNPHIFRRLFVDDCLVNDGEPLGPGETLSFQYANSFQYPLSVSSVACL